MQRRHADLPQLPLVDQVIKESLRLRPVLPNVARRLAAPMQLGGYTLAAGTFVAPCIYLTHHDANLYPEPERFLPERCSISLHSPSTEADRRSNHSSHDIRHLGRSIGPIGSRQAVDMCHRPK